MDKVFWQSAAERAIKTFAQTLLAMFGAGAMNVIHVDWVADLPVAAGAAVLSLLTSISTASVITRSPTPSPSGSPSATPPGASPTATPTA